MGLKLVKTLLRESLLEYIDGLGSLIVYHGSDGKITKFMDNFVGGVDAFDADGPGIYFTSKLDNAKMYGKTIYKVELTPNKMITDQPLSDLNINELRTNLKKLMLSSTDWEGSAMNWDENPNKGLLINLDMVIDSAENEGDAYFSVYQDYYNGIPVDFIRNMVKLGYDGYYVPKPHFDMGGVIHYIVYNPKIIKFIEIVK